MNEINNTGICSIVADGETIPLRFGMPANRIILMKVAVNQDMLIGGQFDERAISWMLFAGYQNACQAKDEYPVKDYEFFYNFVSESLLTDEGQQAIKAVGDCYESSKWTAKAIDELKKKAQEMSQQLLTGTTSSPSATESLDLVLTNTDASPSGNTN